jgi:transcriptional regulator with XRE-family HTH domain
MNFSTNLREARKRLRMTQTELGEKIGVSQRSIANYEAGKVVPHRPTLEKLASVLNIAVEELMMENKETPVYIAQQAEYITEARERYGSRGANEMADLLRRNIAFFAGGDVDEASKDEMFHALASAYFTCKERAREKFGPKEQKNSSM